MPDDDTPNKRSTTNVGWRSMATPPVSTPSSIVNSQWFQDAIRGDNAGMVSTTTAITEAPATTPTTEATTVIAARDVAMMTVADSNLSPLMSIERNEAEDDTIMPIDDLEPLASAVAPFQTTLGVHGMNYLSFIANDESSPLFPMFCQYLRDNIPTMAFMDDDAIRNFAKGHVQRYGRGLINTGTSNA